MTNIISHLHFILADNHGLEASYCLDCEKLSYHVTVGLRGTVLFPCGYCGKPLSEHCDVESAVLQARESKQ